MTECSSQPGPDVEESDHTGLMIIRAWVEKGSTEPLRAHVRLSTDVSVGYERTLTLSRADDVCATVRDWLVDFMHGAKMPEPECR